MFIVISMYTTLFSLCGVVFLTAKVFAADVDNEIDSNRHYELLKELLQRKHPVDFRFSKFLDIHLDVGEKTTSDVEDSISSKIHSAGVCTMQSRKIGFPIQDSISQPVFRRTAKKCKREVTNAENYGTNIDPTQNNDVETGITTSTKVTDERPLNSKPVRSDHLSGVYEIQPNISRTPFHVLCDMEIRSGGWTHIQRRIDGSQDFYLGWKEYKDGFGDLSREFWLGLENIHSLTAAESELLIELVNTSETKAYAYYSSFKVGPESDGYSLSHPKFLGGEIGDSLEYHSGQKFTTKDKDQDAHPGNCAQIFHSAWWYAGCHNSDLNIEWDETPWLNSKADNFRYQVKRRMLVKRVS